MSQSFVSVLDFIQARIETSPQHTAVSVGQESLTYAELGVACNNIADLLRERGVQTGDIVPILTTRCLEMVPCVLAVIMAGARWVPMEARTWSRGRIDSVLGIVDHSIVLITEDEIVGVPNTISREELRRAMRTRSCSKNLAAETCNGPESSDSIAYLIFTSGTTGRPKGVEIAHRSLLHYVQQGENDRPFNLGVNSDDIVLLLFSVAFDAFYGVLFCTLCHGGHVMLSEPSTFIHDAKKCTILPTTPTLLRTLQEASEYANIRSIFLGGESSSPALMRKWWMPGRKIWNTYGPTEATIAVTIAELTPDVPVTLGRPMNGCDLFILDSDLNESMEGEICISGTSLALGYYKSPDQTAEKFLEWRGQRIYRTGDLARRTKQGMIFLGRKDQIVKNRGFLINLEAEVTPILLKQPGVISATAIMHRQKLVAFVTPTSLDADQIRSSVSKQYDNFMTPDIVITKDQLPRTVNGKLDRNALMEELVGHDEQPFEQDSPNTSFKTIWDILSIALEIPTASLDLGCSFEEAGGNSLLAIKVLSSLRQNGFSMSFESLFAARNLRNIGHFLQESPRNLGRKCETHAIGNAIVSEPQLVPMTEAQKGMIMSTIREAPAGYMVISLSMHASLQQLENLNLCGAWESVLDSHSIFRASFDLISGMMDVSMEYKHHWVTLHSNLRTIEDVISQESNLLLQLAKLEPADKLFRPLNRFRLVESRGNESVLLWLVHHALIDGWSINTIFKDVRSHLAGIRPSTLAQFPSFCTALDATHGQVNQSSTEFWTKSMSGLLDGTELKIFQLEQEKNHGEVMNLSIDLGMSAAQIRYSARSFSVSPAVLIYSAWALLLSAYTGKTEVVFGTVFSGRNFPVDGVEDIVGPLINICPLPVRLAQSSSKTELLKNVQNTLLGVSEHQWSASKVLGEITRGSYSRIFDTAVFLEYDLPTPPEQTLHSLPPWTYNRTDVPEFNLTLRIQNIDGKLIAQVSRKGSAYGFAAISRILTHFRNLFTALMLPHTHSVGDVCDRMLDTVEYLSLIRNDSSYFTPYHGPSTLKEAFERAVDQWPEGIAIESGTVILSYSQLDKVANLIARSILKLTDPQAVVAILGDGSLNWLIGVLGTIKAGRVYLPLDTKLPVERMKIMISASSAALCIFPTKGYFKKFSLTNISKLLLDEQYADIASDGIEQRAAEVSKMDDYAYVMFTSGSTGTPKGIKVTHRATLSHLSCEPARMHARPGRRHAQVFSPGFDVNIAEIFGTLCYGATLVLQNVEDPFSHLLGVDATMITPSLLSVLSPTDLKNLDTIYLIGESVSQSLCDRWSGGRTLYNFYGPCECTIAALYTQLQPGQPVTLGRTIPRVAAYVLDAQNRPKPIGAIGEICLSGVQVMEGYIGEGTECINKRVFGHDPFQQGQRMYRTGDIGVWTESMELRFLGRADHQIKVRGYRVELDEIERAIRSADLTVNQVAVIVIRETIYAFVTPEAVDIKNIHRTIQHQLPSYAHPQRILNLSHLPTTPNQKLDRNALSDMVTQASTCSRKSRVANNTEDTIQKAWREAIGISAEHDITPNDDFLALGGNSLRQIVAARKICAELGLRVPLGIFICNTRMDALTKALEDYRTSCSTASAAQLPRFLDAGNSQPESRTVLSYLELELYSMSQQSYSSSSFNVAHEIKFCGSMDLAAFEDAIHFVVSKNEIMRTNFVESNGRLVRIKRDEKFNIVRSTGSIDEIRDEEINKTFDLSSDQLTRITLVTEDSGTTMLLVQHHIITDQTSTRLFMKDLGQVYQSLASGVEPAFPALPSPSYAEWALWKESQMRNKPAPESVAFWRSQFTESTHNLFKNINTPQQVRLGAHSSLFELSELASPPSLELFLAVITLALHRTLGSCDLVIAIPFLDRTEPGTGEMLGLFLDRLPIRLSVDRGCVPTIGDLVESARCAVQNALSHALPYQQIQSITGHEVLFDTMLVFNRSEDCVARDFYVEGVTTSIVPRRARGAKFPLLIEFTEIEDKVVLEAEYFEDVLSPDTVSQICEQARCILERPTESEISN